MRSNRIAIVLGVIASVSTLQTGSRTQTIKPTATGHGVISGTVSFKGTLPNRAPTDMSADAVCAALNPQTPLQDFIVNRGAVPNVLLSVEGAAIEGQTFDVPDSPVILEHQNCQFVPRMAGIQTKQTLLIRNSDKTSHNTTADASSSNGPEEAESWSITQTVGSSQVEKRFTKLGLSVWLSDSLHHWETARVYVFAHPFYSVTDFEGRYRIAGLPPGNYTLRARHERLGEQIVKLRLGEDDSKTIDFSFAGWEIPESELTMGFPADHTIHGGILNGKALTIAAGVYPPEAKARGIAGMVTIEIVIDESGKVVSSRALSGPVQLRQAATRAALEATFLPTLVSGKPVRVSGVLLYNFRLP